VKWGAETTTAVTIRSVVLRSGRILSTETGRRGAKVSLRDARATRPQYGYSSVLTRQSARAALPFRLVAEFALTTPRLVVRPWRFEDLAPFRELNADPLVMEFFPAPLSSDESDAMVGRFDEEFKVRGFCPWAVNERASGLFIGFVGLHEVSETMPFAPAVEVGWRLAQRTWGRGYATEAACAALTFGFGMLGLAEIVSFTSAINVRSRAVMERLSMRRQPADDFSHPRVPNESPLRPHVLYRLQAHQHQIK
jgi:RimJ/RimL family protein N-acetyltransferase